MKTAAVLPCGWRGPGLLALAGLLLVTVLASLAIGAQALAPSAVWQALWHPDGGRNAVIVWQLRVPRTVMGAGVGAALGTAGALMQALTRNPLADPGLLGVNAGAGLAVVLGITFFGASGLSDDTGLALLGAALAAGCVLTLDRVGTPGSGEVRLVLGGAAISASIHAGIGVLTLSNSATFDSYRFWVVGSLNRAIPGGFGVIGASVLVTLALVMPLGGAMNAMALGDDLVHSLGVAVGRMRALVFVAIVILCGTATAVAGPIAFLGLVVPHVVRLLIGPDWRWILPYSVLIGAGLLVVGDILGRVIAPPGEIEAGIVTAFMGAPLLLWLVTRRRGGGS